MYWTLYRLDSNWLNAYKPQPNKSHSQKITNWSSLDAYYVDQLDSAVLKLNNKSGRPIRITLNSVAQEMGMRNGWLQKNLSRMPRTAQALSNLTETSEEFALSRVQWTVLSCRRDDTHLSRANFIKRAGLSRAVQTKRVIEAVEAAFQELKLFSIRHNERAPK